MNGSTREIDLLVFDTHVNTFYSSIFDVWQCGRVWWGC